MNIIALWIYGEKITQTGRHASVPVFLIIYRYVAGPVTVDALDEVLNGLLYFFVYIIWTPRFNLLERKGRAGTENTHPNH